MGKDRLSTITEGDEVGRENDSGSGNNDCYNFFHMPWWTGHTIPDSPVCAETKKIRVVDQLELSGGVPVELFTETDGEDNDGPPSRFEAAATPRSGADSGPFVLPGSDIPFDLISVPYDATPPASMSIAPVALAGGVPPEHAEYIRSILSRSRLIDARPDRDDRDDRDDLASIEDVPETPDHLGRSAEDSGDEDGDNYHKADEPPRERRRSGPPRSKPASVPVPESVTGSGASLSAFSDASTRTRRPALRRTGTGLRVKNPGGRTNPPATALGIFTPGEDSIDRSSQRVCGPVASLALATYRNAICGNPGDR